MSNNLAYFINYTSYHLTTVMLSFRKDYVLSPYGLYNMLAFLYKVSNTTGKKHIYEYMGITDDGVRYLTYVYYQILNAMKTFMKVRNVIFCRTKILVELEPIFTMNNEIYVDAATDNKISSNDEDLDFNFIKPFFTDKINDSIRLLTINSMNGTFILKENYNSIPKTFKINKKDYPRIRFYDNIMSKYKYVESSRYKAIALDFMIPNMQYVMILNNKINDMDYSYIDYYKYNEILGSMRTTCLRQVSFPRIKAENSLKYNGYIQYLFKLEESEVFREQKDKLNLLDMRQQTSFTIYRNTHVSIKSDVFTFRKNGERKPTQSFIADRPFCYFVVFNGIIVYSGLCLESSITHKN